MLFSERRPSSLARHWMGTASFFIHRAMNGYHQHQPEYIVPLPPTKCVLIKHSMCSFPFSLFFTIFSPRSLHICLLISFLCLFRKVAHYTFSFLLSRYGQLCCSSSELLSASTPSATIQMSLATPPFMNLNLPEAYQGSLHNSIKRRQFPHMSFRIDSIYDYSHRRY